MGSYVPNTSRRVLGISYFLLGGGGTLPRSCREFFFSKIFVYLYFFYDQSFFDFYFWGSFLYFKEYCRVKNAGLCTDLSQALRIRPDCFIFFPNSHFLPQHLIEGLLNFRRRLSIVLAGCVFSRPPPENGPILLLSF